MIKNKEIYERYRLIREHHEFSAPLLINPDLQKYNPTIMYIGQETNGWGNGTETLEEIEHWYKNYYYDLRSRKLFWKFIKEIYSIDKNIHEKVVWCNALIAGKIGKIGTPHNNHLLEQLSIDYLVSIYQTFNIEKIIIVAGPNNPYYNIIRAFLEKINAQVSSYPSLNNPIIIEDKIIWTYHPTYQNKKHFINDNIEKIKKIVK
jgi:hypothetical protein